MALSIRRANKNEPLSEADCRKRKLFVPKPFKLKAAQDGVVDFVSQLEKEKQQQQQQEYQQRKQLQEEQAKKEREAQKQKEKAAADQKQAELKK